MRYKSRPHAVADQGFSDGGMAWRRRGRVREGVSPPAGGPGAWPPKFFLKISIENLRFKGHVYAVFMYFKTLFYTISFLKNTM
jgi:hypothetical protein